MSRLAGVLIREEARFDLVQLIEKGKDMWEIEVQHEFYRREIKAQMLQTILGRFGKLVICAVANSLRISAFHELSLEYAGTQRFNAGLLSLAPLESSNGPLLALAFNDDSIRLFRHNSKNKIFKLQEMSRVASENVSKILTLVPRLIIAKRDENEDCDRLWGCWQEAECLDPQGWMNMNQKIKIQCWIGCNEAQSLFVVDKHKDSNDLLVFE